MPAWKYVRYGLEIKLRVIEAARRGDVWEAVAEELGVNYNTARDWVRYHVTHGEPLCALQRGGKRGNKMTPAALEFCWTSCVETRTLRCVSLQTCWSRGWHFGGAANREETCRRRVLHAEATAQGAAIHEHLGEQAEAPRLPYPAAAVSGRW